MCLQGLLSGLSKTGEKNDAMQMKSEKSPENLQWWHQETQENKKFNIQTGDYVKSNAFK